MNYYSKDVYNDLKNINKCSFFNEWYSIVEPILLSDEFQRRKLFSHHDDSVWDHSIDVSFKSFLVAKFYKLDVYTATIAGLLHDFYPYAWQYNKDLETLDKKYLKRYHQKHKSIKELHGFVHAKEASINAAKYFPDLVNPKILSCIETHMFPLNVKPPIYLEGWVITGVDKKISVRILKNVPELPSYVGLKKKAKTPNTILQK